LPHEKAGVGLPMVTIDRTESHIAASGEEHQVVQLMGMAAVRNEQSTDLGQGAV
jgi:hypothetical protein